MIIHSIITYLIAHVLFGKQIAATYCLGFVIGVFLYDAIHLYAHFSG